MDTTEHIFSKKSLKNKALKFISTHAHKEVSWNKVNNMIDDRANYLIECVEYGFNGTKYHLMNSNCIIETFEHYVRMGEQGDGCCIGHCTGKRLALNASL